MAGSSQRASPTLTHHTWMTAPRLTSANRVYSEAMRRSSHRNTESPEQVGGRHPAQVSRQNRYLVGNIPVDDDDAAEDIDDRRRPAGEKEPDEAAEFETERQEIRSAISLPMRT